MLLIFRRHDTIVSLFRTLNMTISLLFRRMHDSLVIPQIEHDNLVIIPQTDMIVLLFRRLSMTISYYSGGWHDSLVIPQAEHDTLVIIPHADMNISLFRRLGMTISLLFRRLTWKSRYSADWTWHSGRSPKFRRLTWKSVIPPDEHDNLVIIPEAEMKVSLFCWLNMTLWQVSEVPKADMKVSYSAGWTRQSRYYSGGWNESLAILLTEHDTLAGLRSSEGWHESLLFRRLNKTISLLFRRLTWKSRYSADWTWHSGRSRKLCWAQSVKALLAASSLASSRELLTTETFRAQKWPTAFNFLWVTRTH